MSFTNPRPTRVGPTAIAAIEVLTELTESARTGVSGEDAAVAHVVDRIDPALLRRVTVAAVARLVAQRHERNQLVDSVDRLGDEVARLKRVVTVPEATARPA